MCGIVGYVGKKNAQKILMASLRRLEYRGYDSAGICLTNNELEIYKTKGKIADLAKISRSSAKTVGIGHTRWATHGVPSNVNSHPHLDCQGEIALVHNGIIENFSSLKGYLEKKGHRFVSDTDTEVLAHLVEEFYHGNLESAVREALKKVVGTYGICLVHRQEPGKIIAARKGSPLVLGLGESEYFLASDTSALLAYTKKVIYLNDEEIVTVTGNGYEISNIQNSQNLDKEVEKIEWSLGEIEKSGFDHFMLKEIFEQPEAVAKALSGRISNDKIIFGGLNIEAKVLRNLERVIIVACGTSWHAGLVGEYIIEELARIPVEVEYASEFRYRDPILDGKTLVIAISQSGETADTLAGLKEAKEKGAYTLGIVNVVGSTIAREVDGGIYTHAGPEIGVASTKAFTTQLTVLIMLAIYIASLKNLPAKQMTQIIKELSLIPKKMQKILDRTDDIKKTALKYAKYDNCLYLGRDLNYPIALEGALKLKEISYVHAEGYPTAEMKHGPIALIDDGCPSIFIALADDLYEKVISNMKEIKARKGRILVIATEGDEEIKNIADDVIYIPQTLPILTGLLSALPMQLIAYYIGVSRGCDVDQPRNLAKSVTVE
jgi:glucosamine--fructose-6-phosphate aminotransferase (isomerizing)